jgi:hypothetical protein
MHNIDRTQLEFDPEMEEEFDYEQDEMEGESYEILPEAEQFELAAELLEVDSEYELDQFLGSLIKRVGSVLGRAIHSPEGQALGGVLKGAVKQALPAATGAIGSFVGGPLGAQVGSRLSTLAQGALGLESETMNYEDFEFEGAKHFVRLAADAVQSMTDQAASPDPKATAQQAVAQAVATHAPALLQSPQDSDFGRDPFHRGGQGRRGHWIRRGNQIVLFGL